MLLAVQAWFVVKEMLELPESAETGISAGVVTVRLGSFWQAEITINNAAVAMKIFFITISIKQIKLESPQGDSRNTSV